MDDVEEIIFKMELSGVTDEHIKKTRSRLIKFSEEMCYSCNLNDIIIYINKLKKKYAKATLRKYVLDIRRLLKEIKPEIADKIKLPTVPKRRKLILKPVNINQLLNKISNLKFKSVRLRLKAAVLLAATSGLRSEEVYKLTTRDIDLENRTVYLSAEMTKDFEDRITFFNQEAKSALEEYLDNVVLKTDYLFPKCTIVKNFRLLHTNLRLKHMRKFFSQQSDRLGMPTSIKKILMGHVVSNEDFVFSSSDIDLGHYDFQDEEDLKKNLR